jgi:hypothetical protein
MEGNLTSKLVQEVKVAHIQMFRIIAKSNTYD